VRIGAGILIEVTPEWFRTGGASRTGSSWPDMVDEENAR
jgi:hypothetical protein